MENIEKIVEQYCGDLRDRVRACHSREVARLLADVIYYELGPLAQQPEVVSYLDDLLKVLVEETFDSEGKNRFLTPNME
ncbi:MAG TPA: hypothetical protein ENK07_04385 [Bacteroidetes bacterium]|nr:hypothetical protein [Bacteroidota bacterium]